MNKKSVDFPLWFSKGLANTPGTSNLGASRRFGTPKQLFSWRGRSFLELALWHADQTLPGRVVVVTGAYTERLDGIIGASGAIQVHNPGWNEGMASSIRAGVAALPADCAAALLMPCDSTKVGAQASAVPTPPVSETDPTIRPALGSKPKAVARPMPVRFCSKMKAVASANRITSGLPPEINVRMSACKPTAAKK